MKTLLILIALLTIFLTGCTEDITKEAVNLKNDISKSYENVTTKSTELKAQIIDTVNKIEETKEDVKEATEAINKVFE